MPTKKKFLLVEDDKVAALAAKLTFEQMGYEVTLVTNGQDAIYEAAETNYDAMIFDIGLGSDSGLDIVEKCRKAGIICPIIALTAQADIDEQLCLDKGFDAVLIKPLNEAKFQFYLAAAQAKLMNI